MSEPMIVSGTTGGDRIFCQFWGEWKDPSRTVRTVDFVTMDNTTGGLRITSGCPREWLDAAWAAYRKVLAGTVPRPTHTITFDRHSQAIFTEIVQRPPNDHQCDNCSGVDPSSCFNYPALLANPVEEPQP